MKDNESVYDEQIRPLMQQIIDICKANGMAIFATVQYAPATDEDGAGLCTTYIPTADQCGAFEKLRRVAVDGWNATPSFSAFTVTVPR